MQAANRRLVSFYCCLKFSLNLTSSSSELQREKAALQQANLELVGQVAAPSGEIECVEIHTAMPRASISSQNTAVPQRYVDMSAALERASINPSHALHSPRLSTNTYNEAIVIRTPTTATTSPPKRRFVIEHARDFPNSASDLLRTRLGVVVKPLVSHAGHVGTLKPRTPGRPSLFKRMRRGLRRIIRSLAVRRVAPRSNTPQRK